MEKHRPGVIEVGTKQEKNSELGFDFGFKESYHITKTTNQRQLDPISQSETRQFSSERLKQLSSN